MEKEVSRGPLAGSMTRVSPFLQLDGISTPFGPTLSNNTPCQKRWYATFY
jgi:hypothetical protein